MYYVFPENHFKQGIAGLFLLFSILQTVGCSEQNTDQAKTAHKPDTTISETVKGSKNTKKLATRLFKLLQQNNFQEYQQIVINLQDITYFSKATLLSISKKNKSKEVVDSARNRIEKQIKNFPQRHTKNLLLINKTFSSTRNKVIRAGANWKELELAGYHLENKHSRYGVAMLHLYLNIKDSKHYYIVKIKDCMKVDRGWIVTQGPVFEGTSKLNKKKQTP